MGQAKQKKQGVAPDYGRVAGAIRRLAEAASGLFGKDCHMHAQFAAHLLRKAGFPAKIVVGYAAWRVGQGDGDVVLHAPAPGFPEQPGVLFHTWVVVDGVKIFDPTTYQLRRKAAELDAIDGQVTTVAWCPDYLLADSARISTLREVVQGGEGLFFYQRIPELEERILTGNEEAHQEDLVLLEMLYANPDMRAIGPNNAPAIIGLGES